MKIRLLLASIIGNILEWYDFALYGYMASTIANLFFPAQNTTIALLQAFSVFFVGYLARPAGGILFGHIGDKFGRIVALRLSMYLMGGTTICMGLLPTYSQLGIIAPILLVILRILQGISAGGEMVSSMVYVFEISTHKKQTFWCSWVTLSCTAGVLLGSIVVGFLHDKYTIAEINGGIWRLPYFSGLILIGFGILTRIFLTESPEFEQNVHPRKIKKIPFLLALQHAPIRMLQIMGLNIFIATSFYTLFVWMPTYLNYFRKIDLYHALTLNNLAMLVLIVLTPCFGYIADKIGRKKIALMCPVLIGVIVYPVFQMINLRTPILILLALIILAICFSLIQGTTAAITSQLFPSEYRLSGIGLAYNISMSLFGGTAPLICTYLIAKTNWFSAPALYVSFSALIGMITIISIDFRKKERHSYLSEKNSSLNITSINNTSA